MTRLITISEDIKQEIAEKVVEQAHPGYTKDYQGEWYVVDGAVVMHAQRNRQFDPWHDGADVISVDDLVFWAGGAERDHVGNFDYTEEMEAGDEEHEDEYRGNAIDFALDYVPGGYDADAYEMRYA